MLEFLATVYNSKSAALDWGGGQNASWRTRVEIKKFEVEFVERTKRLLLDYQGPYDMSNLLNCTLGLIILPYETMKGRPILPFWDVDITNVPNLPPFAFATFNPIQAIDKKSGRIRYYRKTLKVLLQKIRNGLAHQHVEPVNRNGKFDGVIIRNYFAEPQRYMDLEIHFSQQELKDFALFIADEYLR